MIVRIETHVIDAIARLIQQYKDAENLQDIIAALVQQLQLLEDAAYPFRNRLDPNEIEGELLDRFGTIVVQERLGLNDDFYRLLLLAKIGINVSNGEPERVISTFKILTQAQFVHYLNLTGGEIELATDGELDDAFINFVFEQMQKTVAAGVRIDEFIFHDADEPFAFAGPNVSAPCAGFGTVSDASIGGEFATLRRFTPTFAFDGDDSSSAGFGSLEDPIVGGGFVTV